MLPPEIRTETGMPAPAVPADSLGEVPAAGRGQGVKQRASVSERKDHSCLLFAGAMALFKSLTEALLELINKFSKVAGYKTYIQEVTCTCKHLQ